MKLIKFFVLAIIGLTILGLGADADVPPQADAQGLLLVTFDPPEVPQGRTTLMRVFGPPDITRVEVALGEQTITLYKSVDGDWVGLLAANMNAPRGPVEVTIQAYRGAEPLPLQTEPLTVLWGSFFYQNIVLTGSMEALLDPATNRNEEDLLARIYSRQTPEKLWRGAFQQPVPGMLISEFGGIRTYNGGVLEGRHTGTDYRAGTGEPAMATAHGRVVFAQNLPIRGNHVVIDHGRGVLTGYSHLSEIIVVPGQRVLQGDVLGLVGSTGRSQGAHMHMELTVNGAWVDPPQFMALSIPEAAETSAPPTSNEDTSDG